MTDLTTWRNEIRTLSDTQLRDLFNFIGEVLSMNFMSQNINTEFKENRFKSGQVCIHCGSLCVVKNGKLSNKQRYKCTDCKKYFNDFTLSSLSCIKLPLEKWLEYAKCMLLGLNIRKSADSRCLDLLDVEVVKLKPEALVMSKYVLLLPWVEITTSLLSLFVQEESHTKT